MADTVATEAPVTSEATDAQSSIAESTEAPQSTEQAVSEAPDAQSHVESHVEEPESHVEEETGYRSLKERQKVKLRQRLEAERLKQEKLAPQDSEPAPEATSELSEERPRDEQGRFIKKEETAPSDAAATSSEDEASSPPATEVPGFVRIELPPEHPLRERGIDHVVAPESAVREHRALLNQWVTRSQVQQYESRLNQMEEANVRLQAELEAVRKSGPQLDPEKDPITQRLLDDIDRKYSPEMAKRVKDALVANSSAGVDESAVEAELEIRRSGRAFMQEVATGAIQQFPLWAQNGQLQQRVGSAMVEYGKHIDAQNAVRKNQGQPLLKPDAGQFFGWLQGAYRKDPAVQQHLEATRAKEAEETRARIREEERAKLAEVERKRLEEQQSRHRTRPPGVPPVGPKGTRSTDAEVDIRKMTPDERKKHMRDRARARGAAL